MSAHESDREDLMREATALVRRAEIQVPVDLQSGEQKSSPQQNVIAGFRDSGFFSLFFGADPVYHFDNFGRLRRAYCEGRLYRTEGETLARLTRVRTSEATELHRHDLDQRELAEFLTSMNERLNHLHNSLTQQTARISKKIPDNFDVAAELTEELTSILATEEPLAPGIRSLR